MGDVSKETLAADATVAGSALVAGAAMGVPVLGQVIAGAYVAKRVGDYMKG